MTVTRWQLIEWHCERKQTLRTAGPARFCGPSHNQNNNTLIFYIYPYWFHYPIRRLVFQDDVTTFSFVARLCTFPADYDLGTVTYACQANYRQAGSVTMPISPTQQHFYRPWVGGSALNPALHHTLLVRLTFYIFFIYIFFILYRLCLSDFFRNDLPCYHQGTKREQFTRPMRSPAAVL